MNQKFKETRCKHALLTVCILKSPVPNRKTNPFKEHKIQNVCARVCWLMEIQPNKHIRSRKTQTKKKHKQIPKKMQIKKNTKKKNLKKQKTKQNYKSLQKSNQKTAETSQGKGCGGDWCRAGYNSPLDCVWPVSLAFNKRPNQNDPNARKLQKRNTHTHPETPTKTCLENP